MAQCQIEVVNKTSSSSDGIQNVAYLPFSVTTLKLRITNNEEEHMDVTITPKNSRKDEEYCCGFVDDDTGFNLGIQLSWGGGYEEGCLLSLKPNETRYAYIFINHNSGAAQDCYHLTLNITTETGDYAAIVRDEEPDIIIELFPFQIGSQIVHQKSLDNETLVFEGRLVGPYYPRWFPELSNTWISNKYYSQSDIPDFEIHLERKHSWITKDRVEVKLGNRKNIALIVGDMRGSSFSTELFKLDNNNFIIRLWFFWLNHNQFEDRRNLEIIQVEDPVRGPLTVSPELPDSERYDIIVSRSGAVLGVGTDYHWKEYWYKIGDNQHRMKGYIAHWWKHRLHKLLENWILGRKSSDYPSILNVLKNFSPIEVDVLQDIDPRRVVESEGVLSNEDHRMQISNHEELVRGKSIVRSHVPYVENGIIKANMISARVDENVSF